MTTLLDVNVLVALTQPGHEHHHLASAWLQQHQGRGWATTPLTELGLVRLSCNAHVTSQPLSPNEAVDLMVQLRSQQGHQFWTDNLRVGEEDMDWSDIRTHRQITDARLVALARANDGQVATFDRALARQHGETVLLLDS